jgi:hypothetical protein
MTPVTSFMSKHGEPPGAEAAGRLFPSSNFEVGNLYVGVAVDDRNSRWQSAQMY